MSVVNPLCSALIFEDDIDLASQWISALKEVRISAQHTTSMKAAEELCRTHEFDIVISDIFIKDDRGNLLLEGGVTFLSHLRAPAMANLPQCYASIPKIAVTGAAVVNQFNVLNNVKNMPNTFVLKKPFEPSELVAFTQIILSRFDNN